jgi:hypothetical protein
LWGKSRTNFNRDACSWTAPEQSARDVSLAVHDPEDCYRVASSRMPIDDNVRPNNSDVDIRTDGWPRRSAGRKILQSVIQAFEQGGVFRSGSFAGLVCQKVRMS